MTIPFRPMIVLIIVLAAIGALPIALGQNPDALELTAASALENARRALAAFSSIEYEFRAESIGPGKQSNQSKRTEWGRFEYANGKSRSEYTIDSDDYKTNATIAFDGQNYQHLRDNRPTPSITADYSHPYGIVQPVLFPFLNLYVRPDPTKQPKMDMETFCRADLWSATKAAAIFEGRREVDGHPCVVLKFEHKPPFRLANREVCLALDLDCYPIMTTADGGPDSSQLTTRIVEFADLTTSQGRVIVPTRIETKSHNTGSGNQTTFTMTIDKRTLKVNEPIDPQRFNLR